MLSLGARKKGGITNNSLRLGRDVQHSGQETRRQLKPHRCYRVHRRAEGTPSGQQHASQDRESSRRGQLPGGNDVEVNIYDNKNQSASIQNV